MFTYIWHVFSAKLKHPHNALRQHLPLHTPPTPTLPPFPSTLLQPSPQHPSSPTLSSTLSPTPFPQPSLQHPPLPQPSLLPLLQYPLSTTSLRKQLEEDKHRERVAESILRRKRQQQQQVAKSIGGASFFSSFSPRSFSLPDLFTLKHMTLFGVTTVLVVSAMYARSYTQTMAK